MTKEVCPEADEEQKSARQIIKPASSKSSTPQKEFGGPKGFTRRYTKMLPC